MNTLTVSSGLVYRASDRPAVLDISRPVKEEAPRLKPFKSYPPRKRIAILLWLLAIATAAAAVGVGATTVSIGCG